MSEVIGFRNDAWRLQWGPLQRGRWQWKEAVEERIKNMIFRVETSGRLASLCCAVVVFAGAPVWALVISEIHYHPPMGQESLEFIELTNDAFSPEDISGWAFVEGVSFVIPPQTVLEGGESIAICFDAEAVTGHYNTQRALGNYAGSLDAGGERLTLVNHAGVVMQTLRYRDRGEWPAAADGTGHSLILGDIHVDSSDPKHWRPSPELGGSPGEANFFEDRVGFSDGLLFGLDQPWRYRKGEQAFSDPPDAWSGVDFDDSDWNSGLPGFGFGDDDDTTVFDDMQNGYTSVALRLRFTLTEAEFNELAVPILEVNYDDGFCAFLNGMEFARSNCPDVIQWDAVATNRREARSGQGEFFEFPRKAVRVGENVLAVVGYNRTIQDADFSLIPRVLVRHFEEFIPVEGSAVVLNELFRDPSAGGWLELFNPEPEAQDLSGWTLSDEPAGADPYTFPEGTTIGPRRFLVVGEAESTLSLSEQEVALFLRNPSGIVTAATVFDRSSPSALGGASFAEVRYPDGESTGWVTPTATPGAANDVPTVTDLVINEIFYNPPEGRAGEFIELYHRGTGDGAVPLDLSGFRFNAGIDYTFPDGTTVSPGGYVVIAEDPALLAEHYGSGEGGLGDPLGPYEGILSNRGERLRLVDALGNRVDEVRYYDGGEWPLWADGGGSSLELIDPEQPNDYGAAWRASDESQKASWEEHSFTFANPPNPVHSELRLFLVERGGCLLDSVNVDTEVRDFAVLLDSGEDWRFRKGTEPFSEPPDAWYVEDFDDSSWDIGSSGFGFGDEDDETILDDMRLGYTTLAIRKRLVLTAEQAAGTLLLGMRFDDGFCAFVNGERVICTNSPEEIDWQLTATRPHEARDEEQFEIPAGTFRAGENTLAMVGFNRSLRDSDFSLEPRLLLVTGVRQSDNLVANGDFETDTSSWLIRGTHRQSERVETDAFSGQASLEIVATSKGEGQCNGTETGINPRLEDDQTYNLSFATRWQRGGSLLVASGGFGPGMWFGTRDTNMSGNSFGFRARMTVPFNLGSPGEENSARRARREQTGADNLGPLFADVLHTPTLPDPESPVTIRARVVDSDSVAQVRAYYRFSTSAEGDFSVVELAAEGGDRYVGELPAAGGAGRMLFYLEAEDGAGTGGVYPSGAPERPLVYRVESGPVAALNAVVAERPLNFEAIMSNELVNGTVVHEDQVFYNVGMRYRGSPWGRPSRQSLRLRFPKDHLFKGTRRDINVSQRDRANDGPAHFIVMRNGTPEHPAPGSDYKYISARLNGVSWGMPGLFEPYDRRFIVKWFGDEAADDGVLLKGNGRISFDNACSSWRWDEATLHHRAGEAENYRFYYSHGINQSRDNWEPFARLTGLLDATVTDDQTLDAQFESVIDFESFIRTIGPRMMVGDGDALFVANGHNGFLFWDSTEDLWHYLCVDFGGWSFSAAGNLLGVRDTNLARLMRRPRPRRLYYNMLNDYMHGYWNDEASGPYFAALSRSAGVSAGGGINLTRRAVLARIRPFVEAPLRLLDHNGVAVGESIVAVPPELILRGEAPVTMASLLLQEDANAPVPFEPEYTSPTEWTTTLPVTEEEKTFQILGFDREGGLIGTTTLTVVTAQTSGFLRGDADGDSRVTIRDPLVALGWLFRGAPLLCPDAADVNDDGTVDVTDVIAGLEFLFAKGSPPAPPFPEAGADPSEDALECRR